MSCRSRHYFAIPFIVFLALAGCDSPEERVAEHYESGLELLEQGKPEKAVLEFRNALQIDEEFIPARLEFARLLLEQGDARGAYGNYRKVVEIDPANAEARLHLARLLLRGGAFEEALTNADAAHKADPKNPDALVARAIAHLRLGHTDQALADAKRVLEVRPGDPEARLLLVSERLAAGDTDAALALVDRAIGDSPANLSLNLMKLQVLSVRGDKAGIGTHLETMIALYPENVGLHKLLAQWYAEQNRPVDVERELRALQDLQPDNVSATQNLVRLLIRTKGVEAARAEIVARIAATKARKAPAFPFQAMLADFDTQLGKKEAAKALLEDVIAASPDTTTANKARLKLARLAIGDKDIDRAVELVDAVLAGDAKNATALSIRAAIRAERGAYDMAIIDLRAALNETPEDVHLLRLAAGIYERSGSPELARTSLANAVRLSNADPDIVFAYLAFLQKTGRRDVMETVLTDAVDRRPKSAQLLAALGTTHVEKEDWGSARRIAARLRPLDAEAANRLEAAILTGQGKTEEAVALLKEMGQTVSSGSMATTIVQVYARNGQLETARQFVDDILARDPQNAEAQRLKGALLQMSGKVEEAGQAFEKAIAADPKNPASWLALANLYQSTGRSKAAGATLEKGLATIPGNSFLLLEHAEWLSAAGDYAGALAAFEKLYEMRPGSMIAANNLASALSEHYSGDPQKLARAATVARQLAGVQNPAVQDTYGWIKYLQGEADEALRSLIPAAEKLPQNPWVRYHIGMAYADIGRKEEARTHLEAALEFAGGKDFPPAGEIRATLDGLAKKS